MKNLCKKILPLTFFLTFSCFPFKKARELNFNSKERFEYNLTQFYEQSIKESFKELEKITYLSVIEKYGWFYWQTIEETDSLKTGNCVHKSIYFWDLLNKRNISTKIVWGKRYKTSEINHFWLEYSIGKKEFIIECSKNGRIYERNKINSKEYLALKIGDKAKTKIKEFEKRSGIKLYFKNFESPN